MRVTVVDSSKPQKWQPVPKAEKDPAEDALADLVALLAPDDAEKRKKAATSRWLALTVDELLAKTFDSFSSTNNVVTVFPSTSWARKIVHLVCEASRVGHYTLEQPFFETVYSPDCAVGCGCDTVHMQLFPMRLTLTEKSEPNRVTSALGVGAKKTKKKNLDSKPSVLPAGDDPLMWHRLPAPAIQLVLQHVPKLRDVAAALRVCRSWNRLGDSASLWKKLFERVAEQDDKHSKQAKKNSRQKQAGKAVECKRGTGEKKVDWKALCRDAYPEVGCNCVAIRHTHGEATYKTRQFCPEGWDQGKQWGYWE